jgi:hypothetical protein
MPSLEGMSIARIVAYYRRAAYAVASVGVVYASAEVQDRDLLDEGRMRNQSHPDPGLRCESVTNLVRL